MNLLLLLDKHHGSAIEPESTFDQLESLGLEVTQITNTDACIHYLEQNNQWPEVILMDDNLANGELFQAATRIKTMPSAQSLPIIFLLNSPSAETIHHCLSIGDDYLTKPLSPEELSARIHVHSKMRQLNRQLEWQNKKLRQSRQIIRAEHDIVENIFSHHFQKHLIHSNNIRYHISPKSVFHGDVLLTAKGPSGNIYIALGDVTGHGLPAAIGAIPAYQSFRTTAQKGMPVGSIAEEMNKAVCHLLPDNMLLALTLIEYNADANLLNIWSGGMPPMILTNKQGYIKQLIEAQHGPLAMLSELDFSTDVNVVRVEPEDRIYLLTDGVEECRNQENEMFSESRLHALFDGQQTDMFKHIIEQLDTFSGDSERDDDITLVELKCEPCNHICPTAEEESPLPNVPWQLQLTLDADQMRESNPIPLIARMLSNAGGIDIHRDYISTILSELYCNALEHGLLKLDSELKRSEDGFFEYYNLRKKRLLELTDGTINLTLNYVPNPAGGHVQIEVQDSGSGFKKRKKAPANTVDGFGHGINIVSTLCESVEYNDQGNYVTAIYRLSPKNELETVG